jgi:hypothetical protein
MVDTNTYKLMHEDANGSTPAPRNELPESEMRNGAPPAEPFVLLFLAKIRGYGFHNKKRSECLVEV